MAKQAAIVAILAIAAAAYVVSAARWRDASIEAGLWFEPVARSEVAEAFRGLPISLSDRRDALYTLRVTQEVLDLRFKRLVGVAGQSRGISGFGGSGSVSFNFLANGAMAWAPDDAERTELVAAIGRGIGRTAVHEFTHQILPTAPIHDSRDDRSYEFASAARPAQYYGPMHWDLAWPLLQQRVGK